MKYEYKGILVESGTPLDSAMFRPIEAVPTEKEAEAEHEPVRTKEKRTKSAAGRRKQQ